MNRTYMFRDYKPVSDWWDPLLDQAVTSRILQKNKRIELENRYGDFVDESPSFPVDEWKVILCDSLCGRPSRSWCAD